jgi:hypothetical protein
MLRLTVTVAMLFATLATSNELMAQRRAPLRNFARQLGARWGTGFHNENPGPFSNYYSPWSQANTPTDFGQDASPDANSVLNQESYFDGPNPGQSTVQPPVVAPESNNADPSTGEQPADGNSATWLQRQIPSANSRYQPAQPTIKLAPGYHPGNNPISNQTNDSAYQDNLLLNRQLQPYQNTGHLKINNLPAKNLNGQTQTPTQNTWGSQYNQQFEQSQPFIPNNR